MPGGLLTDFSSIGPSQSASQISYPFPEPVTNAGPPPDISSQPTSDKGLEVPTMPRPHSSASTAVSSSYHTPATAATYKVEPVTYAPAISLIVPASSPSSPRDIKTPLALNPSLDVSLPPPIGYASESEMHTKMYIPAAHAINEYEMPTAKVGEAGNGTVTSWRHSRGESQERLGQWVTSGPNGVMPNTSLASASSAVNRGGEPTALPTTMVGSALIEVFDDDDEDDSETPVEADELIKQGKLAVVENPKFMSEERRRELDREREKWMKQPSGAAVAEKSEEPERPKKDDGHVTFVPVSPPSTPNNKSSLKKKKETFPNSSSSPSTTKISPSKRFFGGLKGFFVKNRQPSASPAEVPSRNLDSPIAYPGDDSDDESPTKPSGGFQTFLLGTGAKKKDGSSATGGGGGGGGGGTRWSTRTDRNIRKLTKNVDERRTNEEFQHVVVQQTPAGGGGGAKEAVVDLGKRRRVSSVVTNPPPAAGASSAREKPPAATRTPAAGASAVSKGYSSDNASAAPPTDLGKRRRVNSVIHPPVGASSSREISPAATRTPAVDASAVSKGYSSDTAAATATTPSKPRKLTRQPSVGKTQTRPAGASAVSKGDTAAAAAPSTVTPTATTPSKTTTLTRQPSVGKTQTRSTSNPPIENTEGSRQPHVQPSQPQPHRQHSASSSGGGAIVLTAGATQPTGTLISRPGWDAQALPTAGGGLSRNNSILSGVSGGAGGSSSGGGGGGMSKKKKQRQTTLGHGMGSGTSLGRRSSLGSSSGHGGGVGGPTGSVVQPTQPAQSLMSIVEDVAKHNRDWNQESSQLHKNRNKIVGGGLEKDKTGPVVGMVDVVRAPRSFGRSELAQLDPAAIKARVMETSTSPNLPPAATGASGGVSRGRMIDIKAPGSIFDQRDTAVVGSAAQQKVASSDLTQSQQVNVTRRSSVTAGPAATSTPVARGKRPAKSPLRSAMKNPSRTPSPLTSPFLVPHVQKQQQALQDGSRRAGEVTPVPVPPAQSSMILGSQQHPSHTLYTTTTTATVDIRSSTMANGRADSASQRRKGKRQVRSADDAVGEDAGDSTSANDSGNEKFYTDDEGDTNHHAEAVVVTSTDRRAPPMLNGHADGYTGSSDLSHSTTSTAAVAVHRPPPPTTTSPTPQQPTTGTLVARRRKSVRVSLQPSYSPPPVVEDDSEEQPWVWKREHYTSFERDGGHQLHVHAPVPVAAGSNLLLNPAHRQKVVAREPSAGANDIWEDSDEDVEYQNAKLLLTRAAKNEKDMKVFVARGRS